jgi:hypothetical protein
MLRPEPSLFIPIRAGLGGVPIPKVQGATGLAESTATMIRLGKINPLVRNWEVLADLAGVPHPLTVAQPRGETNQKEEAP